MSKICEKCGRKPTVGHRISHSHHKTKRRFMLNLVTRKIFDPKTKISRKMQLCTRCLRNLSKK